MPGLRAQEMPDLSKTGTIRHMPGLQRPDDRDFQRGGKSGASMTKTPSLQVAYELWEKGVGDTSSNFEYTNKIITGGRLGSYVHINEGQEWRARCMGEYIVHLSLRNTTTKPLRRILHLKATPLNRINFCFWSTLSEFPMS